MTRPREEAIESLLYNHPYLLDPDEGVFERHGRQYAYKGGRIDIVFKQGDAFVLVEVKRTAISDAHIEQLKRYITDMQSVLPLYHAHYLVGAAAQGTPDVIKFSREFEIRPRLVGRDIPRRLKFNNALGRYVRARDYESDVIEIRI